MVDKEALSAIKGSSKLSYDELAQADRPARLKQFYKEWAAQEYYYLVHKVKLYGTNDCGCHLAYQFGDSGKIGDLLMVLYVGEQEMTERFIDGLKEAASRCRELVNNPDIDKPGIFVKLVSALKVSAGSAHQLSMDRADPQWLLYRDALEAFIIFAQENVFNNSDSPVWLEISNKLDELAASGKKLLEMKARKRIDILLDLDNREKMARTNETLH